LQLNVFVAVENYCLTFHTRARSRQLKTQRNIYLFLLFLYKTFCATVDKEMLINIVTEAAAHFFSWAFIF